MKVVFLGTPDFALTALQKIAAEHEVVCVYTRAPEVAGRGKKLTKSPVHQWAEEQGIEVRTPRSLKNTEEQDKYCTLQADIAVVAAYGLILPKRIIEAFPLGCINIHGSLLPRWRGAAPIQRAIEAGDVSSGITIMKVVEALDAGDMLLKREVPIDAETTGEILHDKLSEVGADLILEALDKITQIKPEPQDESLVTYAQKLDKAESKIDFSQPAEMLERKIRAFNPYPGMFFEYEGERFKVLKAKVSPESGEPGKILQGHDKLLIACGNKSLDVQEMQRQGKKKMHIKDVLNGFQFQSIVLK